MGQPVNARTWRLKISISSLLVVQNGNPSTSCYGCHFAQLEIASNLTVRQAIWRNFQGWRHRGEPDPGRCPGLDYSGLSGHSLGTFPLYVKFACTRLRPS